MSHRLITLAADYYLHEASARIVDDIGAASFAIRQSKTIRIAIALGGRLYSRLYARGENSWLFKIAADEAIFAIYEA